MQLTTKFFKNLFLFLEILNQKIIWLAPLFILFYIIVASIVSLNRYWQYQTFYFDFGIFDMAIWKASRFTVPTIDHFLFGGQKVLIFADHFNPSMLLLSILYWFTDRREVLFISQVVTVGVSAFVGFIIAKKRLNNNLAIFSLVFAYLGYVGLQNALISDIHEITFATLPLMLVFWAIFNKKWGLYFLFLIIFLGFKENFAGLGIALGIYIYFKEKNSKIAIATILLSLLWGFLVIKFLIPFFSDGKYIYLPDKLPSNLQELISSLIYPSSKIKTVFFTFLNFGFLPILDLSILPAVFENFFERFVLSSYKGQDLGLHYNATLSPLMFIGSLYALELVQKNKRISKLISLYAFFIILVTIFLHKLLHGPLGLFYNPVFYEQNKRVEYVNNFLSEINPQGLIMTQNDLAVRYTHMNVMLFRWDYEKYFPDEIIFNLTPGQNPNSFYPINFDRLKIIKGELLKNNQYKLMDNKGELYWFKKIK